MGNSVIREIHCFPVSQTWTPAHHIIPLPATGVVKRHTEWHIYHLLTKVRTANVIMCLTRGSVRRLLWGLSVSQGLYVSKWPPLLPVSWTDTSITKVTQEVHPRLSLDVWLVDAVLCDSFTPVHLPDAVCNVDGDFFCRHSFSISFSLFKSLKHWIEWLETIQILWICIYSLRFLHTNTHEKGATEDMHISTAEVFLLEPRYQPSWAGRRHVWENLVEWVSKDQRATGKPSQWAYNRVGK